MIDAEAVLKRLDLGKLGKYKNHFYVIQLEDSNEYARMYTKLSDNAINTEFPSIDLDDNGSTHSITNYFEIEEGGTKYNIFLMANFDDDEYKIKIGEA